LNSCIGALQQPSVSTWQKKQATAEELDVLRRFSGLAMALVLATGMTALAQDTAGIVWKFEKDKPFFQEMSTKTTQTITVMGMTVGQTQEHTFYFKWTPLKQEGDKWILKQTIEGVKMKIDIAGTPITFDSTAAAQPGGPNNALAEFFKAMIGAEFTLTLDKNMKVEKIEGRDEFLKKLGAANQQMEPLLKKLLSDDAMKKLADPTFGMIPPALKKVDENWTNTTKLDLGPLGNYDGTYKYTYKGKDATNKDLDKIDVETTLTYKAPTAEGELPFKIRSADIKTEEKLAPGTIFFDSKLGRVASSKMVVKINGTLDIEIGGMNAKVDLKQEQTTEIKTQDKSYVTK